MALARFDPLVDALPEGARLLDLRSPGPFLVQFPYPVSGKEIAAIEGAGGTVVAYVADGGFIVVGSPGLAVSLKALAAARWVGLLPPALRMRPDAAGAATVAIEYAGGAQTLARELDSVRAHAVVLGRSTAIIAPGPGGAPALSALPHVIWVERYGVPSSENYHATITDRIRELANSSSYSSTSGALWTFNPDPVDPRFLGYTGAGITVDVTDTGVDRNFPGFSGRVGAGKSWSGAPVDVDSTGHGTHVAGTTLGDGGYRASDTGLPRGLYAGAAPGATLVTQTYDPLSMNYSGMADFAWSSGATVSVNSWGDQSPAALGCYTAVAAEYDGLTIDASPDTVGNQPLLFVFSAGNVEDTSSSISPPSTAKNVISVGATGNDYALPSDRIFRYSSFGPTEEGRIKPDLVAPGEMVASANSSWRGAAVPGPQPPLGGLSYAYLSGTSQAAPQVAGAAAVAGQYLRDARGALASPALLKALLINGARPLPFYSWPGPEQGWGRLDLASSLLNTSSRRVDFVDESYWTFYTCTPSDVVQVDINVDAGEDIRATLVWSDPPGSAAAPALQNDLDLELRNANDSLIFEGNRINSSSAYSVPGASSVHYDGTNNVEVVRVPTAEAGQWKAFVRCANLGGGPQSFALAYSGALRHLDPDLAVESLALSSAAEVQSGDTVSAVGQVANLGEAGASSVTVSAYNADDLLAPPYATRAFTALGPGERANFSLSFVPPDGANSIVVRAAAASPEADPSNNFATLAFFVVLRQPQLTGATDVTQLPGQTAVFSLTATNRGNTADTLWLTENPSGRDPNWTLSFSRQNFSLGPGQSASLTASMQVPGSAANSSFAIAELRLESAANQSRVDFLTVTARAGSVHVVRLSALSPVISVASSGAEEVPVRLENAGNSQEEVGLSITPLWPDSSSWSGSALTVGVSPGQTVDMFLNLTNNDTGAAGYRGQARLRAVLSSTGQVIDQLVPVFVEARSCLSLTGPDLVLTQGAQPALAELSLVNCGNIALTGSLVSGGPSGHSLVRPANFAVGPGQTQAVNVVVRAAEETLDGAYAFSLRADASQGLSAVFSSIAQHDTGVRLVALGPQAFVVAPGVHAISLRLQNTGDAGWIGSPRIGGVPAGWRVAPLHPSGPFPVASDSEFDLTLAVDPGNQSDSKDALISLTFFAGSPREGEFVPVVNIARGPLAGPATPTQPLWPTSGAPAIAVGSGAAAALAAALALAPSRRLYSACPACGKKAPRFDTFMNPRCSDCGESLKPHPPNSGERK